MSDLKTVIDLIEAQGEAWNEFKSVQDNRFETIEENMRDFKNWTLKETSPFGFRNEFSTTSPTQLHKSAHHSQSRWQTAQLFRRWVSLLTVLIIILTNMMRILVLVNMPRM